MSCGCGGKCGGGATGPTLLRAGSPGWESAMRRNRATLGAEPAGGCGAALMASIVQAADGRTKTSPYGFPGLYCNQGDASAWWAQVQHIATLVKNTARSVAPANMGPVTAQYQAYQSALANLPDSSVWTFGESCTEAVSAYIGNLELAACLIERLQTAGAAIVPPGPPAPPPPITDQLAGAFAWLLPVGVIGALFLLSNKQGGE